VALVRPALAAALLVAVAGAATAAPQPASRIVDRTVLCKMWGTGYPDPLRVLAVVADAGYAQATNGPQGSPRYVAAQVATEVNGQGQVVLSRAACAARSKPIKLSAAGLRSGETDFGNKWRCPVPAAVVIRIRAVFKRPVALRAAVDAPYLSIATGSIVEGAVAVETKNGKRLAFASVDRRGQAAIFVARPLCQRNRY
jgi:hypothetical protein